MTILTTIGNTVIASTKDASLNIDDANNERSIAQVVAQDATGLLHYQKGQQISVVDSTLGTLFAGNVNDSTEENLVPNAQINSTVSAIDYTYLADKRTYVDDDSRNAGQYAGTILTDLAQRYLAQEGVVLAYAMRRDTFFADFAQGVLANTTPANNVGDGNLELSPAGAAVSVTEKTNAVFGSGTLNNTSAVNNALQPTLASALMVQAYLPVTLTSGVGYTFLKIWSGSMAIAANDTFHYEMWVPSTNADIVQHGIDFVCTDGTILQAPFDQLNFASVMGNDLTKAAVNNWYARDINIAALNGKTIVSVRIALEGAKAGLYTAYFKNVYLASQSGSPFFGKTATVTNVSPPQQLQNQYFQPPVVLLLQVPDKIAAPPLQGATPSVYRVSPVQSIDAVKLLKSSFISWIQTTPGKTSVNIAITYNGGSSYIPCTNNAPLPGMPAGSNIAGLNVQIREEFYTTDSDPTQIPTISYLSWNIQSSYNATKSDVTSTYITGGSWASGGTLSNTANTSGNLLTLNSILRNWNKAESSSQTTFGLGTPAELFQNLQYALGCDATSETRSRFDFASTWADFTLEFDVLIDTAGIKYGCVYRTTGWQNNDGTWAYAVELSSVDLKLQRGTNLSTGTGTITNVATLTFSSALSLNNWYRVKVVASGSSHKIYVNDTLYINATDGTYTAAGNVGLRNRNTTGSRSFVNYDNFGITASLAGTWTSNNISLTGAGSYLNSIITWADASSDYSQEIILVEASINGGSTWLTCTNGQPIPNFTPAQSLSGVNLTLRVTLTGTSATSMPGLNQLTVRVLGAFSATGTRISPVLDLSPTGRAGSTLVNWNALTPAGTGITVEIAPDVAGVPGTWTAVSNGGAIPNIFSQPDPTLDSFDKDSSANYTQGNFGGNGMWTWDVTNSRVTGTGGTRATLVYNALSVLDGFVEIDMDQADDAGPIADYGGGSTLYFVKIWDASGTSLQNTIQLFKRVASVSSQIGSNASISFTRGTYHRIRLDVQAGVLTVLFDGVQVISFTDGSPLAAGKFGLYENSTVGGRFYNVRMQPYGDLLAGKKVYSRTTLISTDPTLTSQQQDLIVVAHDPNISNGTLIPKTAWQFTQQISGCIDDLAKQCNPNFWWAIVPDPNNAYKKILKFLPFGSVPAPWIATGLDIQTNTRPTVQNIADLYGNRFRVNNAVDIVAKSKSFTGDGSTTNFNLDFPVDTVTSITYQTSGLGILTRTITFGVQNVDTGKDWYYQNGSTLITQDAAGVALNQLQTITVFYNAQVPYTAMAEDKAEQGAYQLLETGASYVMRPFGQSTLIYNPNNNGWNSSGVVERTVDGTGLNRAAADTLAANLLARYKVRGRTLSFKTLRPGLQTGQVLTVFFSQFGISDKAFLINHVVLSFQTKADGTQLITYQVEASETPFIGSFIKLFQA